MPIMEPVKTPEQHAAARIRNINESLLSTMQNMLCEGYDAFWSTPGTTPQGVADVFGADAITLLGYHAQLVGLVATICQATGREFRVQTAIPDEWQYTVDENGLMVITAK